MTSIAQRFAYTLDGDAPTHSYKIRFGLMREIAFCLLFVLLGCTSAQPPQPFAITGPTMGTTYAVKYFVGNGVEIDYEFLSAEISKKLADINQLMSTYIADSELNRFNNALSDTPFRLSPETFQVMTLAWQVSESTGGAFDATVSPLVDLWGFGAQGRRDDVPDDSAIRALLGDIGYQYLSFDPLGLTVTKSIAIDVDLSAIAKGFAVDYLSEFLREQGVKDFMVEVGGEIYASGTKVDGVPWRIAIESPIAGARKIQRILDLNDIAVATSGDYRNYFERDGKRFSHTIDPRTGYPIDHSLASVTVLHESTAMADALATAYMVMGAQKALQHANAGDIAALFIIKDGEGFVEQSSAGFPVKTL